MTYLSDEFGRWLGNAEEQAFLTGTGTGQPSGILTDTNLDLLLLKQIH